MKNSILNLSLIFLFVLLAFSCKKEPTSPTYPGWTTYSFANISYGTILAIDAHGNKWLGTGTQEGVFKFDGTNWTQYAVVNGYYVNFVSSLVGDSSGNMWMTADCGLAEFNGTTWMPPSDTINSHINFFEIGHPAIDFQGNIWAVGNNFLVKFDGMRWTTFNAPANTFSPSILCLSIDVQGNKWIGTVGNGVIKFDGTNWITYNTKNSGIASDSILSIAKDSKGNIWLGSYTYGAISKFNGTNWTTYFTQHKDSVCIWSIAIDKQGNIWAGYGGEINGGVTKFDGNNWTTYTNANSGLPGNYVKSIAIDAQGNIWFSIDDVGLCEFKD